MFTIDLAVSAPFDQDGVVYIYLGSKEGLSTTPSQKIVAPESSTNGMFGYALSRGVDIDGNGYNDLAIGSPNTEKVFIYKTYPVIKIHSFMNFSRHTFSSYDTQLNLSVCLHFERTKSMEHINFVEVFYSISVDKRYINLKRASFDQKTNNTWINSTMNKVEIAITSKCWHHTLFIEPKTSKKNIEFNLNYWLTKKVDQNDTVFCEDCVTLDTRVNLNKKYEIPFSKECLDCTAGLSIIGIVTNIE